MASTLEGPFRLGDWTVRPRENCIERDGESRSLEPKVMDVLTYLASEPGRIHLRQDILDSVWEGAFVTDEVLTNAVWELRRALGDDARTPHYVRTVARKGYGLVAPVEPLVPEAGVSPERTSVRRGNLLRVPIVLFAALAIVAIAGIGLWLQRLQSPRASWPDSVVVLPLEAISDDPSERAFAVALTDSLTTELAASDHFEVPSRSSVLDLQGRGLTAIETARTLDAEAFLEGTLSFSETGRARLSLQLVDRRRDRHLWARIFEDDIRENLSAQRRFARRVALALVPGTEIDADRPSPSVALAPPGAAPRSWRFRTGGEVWSDPVLTTDGLLVFGSDDGSVYALDPATGKERWRFAAPGPIRDRPAVGPSLVYVGSANYLHGLDAATGEEVWRRRLSVISPPVYFDRGRGIVVVGSYDRHVYGLDPDDGSNLWRVPTRGEHRTAAALTGRNGAVGTDDGELLVVDLPTGEARIRLDLASAVAGVTAGPEGDLFVATDEGFLYRFSVEGREIWRRLLAPRLGARPLVAGGIAYQGTGDGRMLALDADDGTVLWTFRARDGIGVAPRLHGETLFVGSLDQHLYALDAVGGTERWRFATGGWIVARPLVVDERVVFSGLDGIVYSLPLEGPTELPPVPAWPEAGRPRLVARVPGPELLWRRAIPEPARLTVGGGRVVVSTGRGLSTLDARSGEPGWRFPTAGGVEAEALLLDDRILFGSSPGLVFALDPGTGHELWRHDLGESTVSSPAAGDQAIYLGDDAGRIHALDLGSGAPIWTAATEHFVNGSPLVLEDRIVVGSCDEHVWSFGRARGRLLWKSHAGECVVTDGARFEDLGIFGSYAGEILALDLDLGTRRWTFSTGGEHIWYRPLVTEGAVYVGSGDYNLYALDAATGEELWRFRTGNRALTEVARHGETILFGSHDRSLYAVDRRSGSERWRLETSRTVENLEVVDDVLYFVGDDGWVFAYRLPPDPIDLARGEAEERREEIAR